MRDGDIGTAKAEIHQGSHHLPEAFWRHAQRDIGAINAIALQPEPMQPRGA